MPSRIQDSSRESPIVRLARVLDSAPLLAEEVELATQAPERYVQTHSSRLRRRGITARQVVPELPWLALVDGLLERNRAVEIDWRSDFDELKRAFGPVSPAPPPAVWDDVGRQAAKAPMSEVLASLAARLSKGATTLCEIARPTDSFVVLLLPKKRLPKVRALALEAGGCVDEFPAKPPASSTRPAEPMARAGTWKSLLAQEGVTNTNGLLMKLVRDEHARARVREKLADAPKREAPTLRALLGLLDAGDSDAPESGEDVRATLEAARYLTFAKGSSVLALRTVAGCLRTPGVGSLTKAQKEVAVRAIQFAQNPEVGREAMRSVSPEQRNSLEDLVTTSLKAGSAPLLVAAANAAKVIGGSIVVDRLRALQTSAKLPLVVQHAKSALSYLEDLR